MNIEKTISEHAVSDILTQMLECQDRIVTEDVAPLFDQATGLDTPPASGTVTTTIEESRSVIIAIIRKAWTATLTMLGGASVISYIAAAYTYLRNRLQGNETYGIPDRRPEISASSPLAANLALLNDRKISGAIGAPDGISFAQLVGSSDAAASVTEITDDNTGWTLTKSISFKNHFPNSNKVQLGCGEIRVPFEYDGGVVFGSDEEYKFTALKKITPSTAGGFGNGIFNGDVQSHDIDLGDTEEIATGGFFGLIRCSGSTTDYRYALIARKLRICSYLFSRYNDSQIGITKVVLGKIETNNFQPYNVYGSAVRTPNLIHWEFGQDTAVSLNLQHWNPSVALDASRTDLIEEGSTAQNNLQQFLENFRDVLFTRLAKRTSTTSLTLTLSPAVYKAVYGLDADYNVDPNALAQTASLADFGITTEDLNEIEIAAGITTATKYATWLDTYRGAIYWNVQYS